MLANLNEIFAAHPNGAVAGFNVFGYEDAAAVIRAAESLQTPVILMTNRDALVHMPVDVMAVLLLKLAEKSSVPVCVHLDHAITFEAVKAAADAGYNSVMFDGSQLSLEENARITSQVIDYVRPLGISVEAELGSVGYADPNVKAKSYLTEPDEVQKFLDVAPVDALAVAVGTIHRMFTQEANIEFERLDKICEKTEVPIVIHGSTGVSDEDLHSLAVHGVKKVNIGTSLRMTFGHTLRQEMTARPEEFDRIKLFPAVMNAVEAKAAEKMRLLTCLAR